ncbi:MAG: TRAM domain-containing protein [Actinobacteria bacterium]|nr:TRAM domain-containing protein [Actinomycetota bacterium]
MVEFIRLIFVVVGTIGAYQFGMGLSSLPAPFNDYKFLAIIIFVIIGAGVGYVVGGIVGRRLVKTYAWFESKIQKISPFEIVFTTAGLLVGLILAWLVSLPFGYLKIDFLQFTVAVFAFAIFGYLGVHIALKKSRDLKVPIRRLGESGTVIDELGGIARAKILDTSAIIDGRIADIVRTGFLEGKLVVPGFVLRELQMVADSDDQLKRNRGRRGLDILKTLQRESDGRLEILERDYPELSDVDAKLVRLALNNGGVIVTNDYNLNKVADLQGTPVLNLNEVADALRPVVLPGENMVVDLIREGKEVGQGVGYLDDGTMVVVDGGKTHVGREVEVLVTSVLQTPAGRMIFSKLKE